MASDWKKKYYRSDLERVVLFLPTFLAVDCPNRKVAAETIHGVLLFADISGGGSMQEQHRPEPFWGTPSPLEPCPSDRAAVLSLMPKESGMGYLGRSSPAGTSAEPGQGKV